MGLNVDILPARHRAFDGYELVCAPGLMHMPDDLKDTLARCGASVVLGPRSGARDANHAIPVPLPPAVPGLDVTVARVQSMRPDSPVALDGGGQITGYLEELEGTAQPVLQTPDGAPVAMRSGRVTYMGGWGDAAALDRLLRPLAEAAGLSPQALPDGLRVRETETERFWFNYNAHPIEHKGRHLPPAGVLRESRQDGEGLV
jgi:beta-galactosidase